MGGKQLAVGAAATLVGRLGTASRLVALIGLVVLIGGGLLASQVADAAPNRKLLWVSWAFLLVGSLGQYGLHGASVVGGSPSDALRPSVWSEIADSRTGTMLIVRLLLMLVIGALLIQFDRRARSNWRGVSAVVSLGLIITFATIGHASALHPSGVWVTVDALHLAAIALWIGGLLMLAFGTPTWLFDADAAGAVRRFNATAMVAVPMIAATGVAQTLGLADLDDVGDTSWGRTLLVKVAVATVLIALGGVSQWLVRHDGPPSLKRNVLVEALIGIAVIGLAAALVALPPQG